MAVAVVVCVSLVNIILWMVLFSRIKRIFSTETILEKTRDELNGMLANIDRDAERNITLIEERIRQLRSVTAEADRHIALLQAELEKAVKKQELQGRLQAAAKPAPVKKPVLPAEKYRSEQLQGDLFESRSAQAADAAPSSSAASEDMPQIVVADNPIKPAKTYKQLIKEYAARGMTVDQIAAEVGRSTQEVEFLLEFS